MVIGTKCDCDLWWLLFGTGIESVVQANIRGIAAERRAEGGWHLLTGRPALEQPNVAVMHPDGGIVYQTPPGRNNTVCWWLVKGQGGDTADNILSCI